MCVCVGPDRSSGSGRSGITGTDVRAVKQKKKKRGEAGIQVPVVSPCKATRSTHVNIDPQTRRVGGWMGRGSDGC